MINLVPRPPEPEPQQPVQEQQGPATDEAGQEEEPQAAERVGQNVQVQWCMGGALLSLQAHDH